MKKIIVFVSLIIASSLLAGDSASGYFGQLKSLAGSWQGKGMGEKTVSVTYEVVANGSAVMERMRNEDEPEMVTMYHLDGDRLMMTHYCSAMNQPRMVADLSKGLSFHMIDITNLANEKAGHMKAMSIDIEDENHISHNWTFSKDGQDMAVPIMLERVMMTGK